MPSPRAAWTTRGPEPGRQHGFTLIESILVIATLGVVSVLLMKMQRDVHLTQTLGRDQVVGAELARSCAERLLAVRRHAGYGSVSATVCDGMGGLGGYAANPDVTLQATVDGVARPVSTCIGSTCTATIAVRKNSGPSALTAPVVLRLSDY